LPNHAFTQVYQGTASVLMTRVFIENPVDKKKIQFDAIWDTGATKCAITEKVAKSLGLKQISETNVFTAAGMRKVPVYLLNLLLPNKVRIAPVQASLVELHGADMLIGMDVIGIGDFCITNPNKKTTLSFVFPSMGQIDYVYKINKKNGKNISKIGRNAPCPCGSGRKFKNCCGK